jgi:hypothetical protein
MSSMEANSPRFGAVERTLVQRAGASLLGDRRDQVIFEQERALACA